MSKIEETYLDQNRDGVWDHYVVRTIITDSSGKLDYEYTDTDEGFDGSIENTSVLDATYDSSGRLVEEYRGQDNNGDSWPDVEEWRSFTYDSSNRVVTERTDSLDFNADGQSDYTSILNNVYNSAGQYVSRETVYLYNGAVDPSSYRLESFTYDASGRLSTLEIDDWSLYDYVIGYKYNYTSSGQLSKVQYRDEFVFGDTKWHTSETYKYSGGRLAESNLYDEFFLDSHVLEVKTKFVYDTNGWLASELATGQDNAWHTIEKQLTEYTRDSLGREVSKLISVDQNLDNVWDTDGRTLVTTQYGDDGSVVYQATDRDYGDGILEHLFTSQDFLVA